MKKLILIPALLLNACAYNSTMGKNDRFEVSSTTSLFAPSVTTVVDTSNPDVVPATFAGQSLFTQLGAVAGPVAGGYLLGQGIGKSGTKVTQNGGGASATGGKSLANGGSAAALSGSSSNAKSFSDANASAKTYQSQGQGQWQGQGQTLGGKNTDGFEVNY